MLQRVKDRKVGLESTRNICFQIAFELKVRVVQWRTVHLVALDGAIEVVRVQVVGVCLGVHFKSQGPLGVAEQLLIELDDGLEEVEVQVELQLEVVGVGGALAGLVDQTEGLDLDRGVDGLVLLLLKDQIVGGVKEGAFLYALVEDHVDCAVRDAVQL